MRQLHKCETDKNNKIDANLQPICAERTQLAAHLVDPRLLLAPHQWSCHGNTRVSAERLSVFFLRSALHTCDLTLQAMARNSFKVGAFTFQMVSQHLGRGQERKGEREGGREGGGKGEG